MAGSFFSSASLGLIWKAGIRTSDHDREPDREDRAGATQHERGPPPPEAGVGIGRRTKRFGITRTRLMPGPSTASTAGRKVIEASTATAGMSMPPMPIERMNGSGRSTMLSRPIATVEPETITDRPACAIVCAIASSVVSPWHNSSRKRKIISSA